MVKTLFNRVNTHISDNKLMHREQLHIRSTLQLNGFPTRTTFLSPRKACSQDCPYKHFTSILYVQDTSEKIRRVLNEEGVNVAMRLCIPFAMFCHYPNIHIPPKILAVLSTKSPVWIATLFILDRRNEALSLVWQNTNGPPSTKSQNNLPSALTQWNLNTILIG